MNKLLNTQRPQWIRLAIASSLVSSSVALASPFDDCILQGMKGVTSDAAANVVRQACINKRNAWLDVQDRKLIKLYGPELPVGDYTTLAPAERPSGSDYRAVMLTNSSQSFTLTYAKLVIKDDDYDLYKPDAKDGWHPKDFDEAMRLAWQLQRTHTFYYRLRLPPGKSIRLLFRAKPGDFTSEVKIVRGMDSKWTDAIGGFSTSATPELKDPLAE